MTILNNAPLSSDDNSLPINSDEISAIQQKITQSEVYGSLEIIVIDAHDKRQFTTIPYEKNLQYNDKLPDHLIALRSKLFRLLSGTTFACFCVLIYMIIDHSVDTQVLILLSSFCGFTTQFVIQAWSNKE
jgi:hypothetical protein